jgi:hypothetical protein
VRAAALLLLAAATAAAAAAGARTPAPAAADMLGSVRMAVLRSCGPAPACAAYAPRAWRGVEPAIAVESLACAARGGRPPLRRCSFALKAPRRDGRLSCSADFHERSADSLAPWSDLKVEKPRRVYLPTGSIDAPSTLGPSTLRCSGSLIDYVR